MNKVNEALRLADAFDCGDFYISTIYAAAAELRRLSAVNAELLGALQILLRNQDPERYVERESAIRIARAAIGKAGGAA